MSSEVLVLVENVSKKFCRSLKKSLWYGVTDMTTEVLGAKGKHSTLRDGEFWAVKDVSFELKRGEGLGLIGRNGAGKTTLLKMLNGLIKPDHGRIEMRGRVGALIALGAGFSPILTGRENIYVNGSVLGLTKQEIDSKIDAIIDFADIREFIDSPVQTYSSGMQVRLGFAVATAMEPDVLILDEVLAVGDAAFRNRCYARISELRRRAAIIFVSHNMEHVGRICNLALMMQKGRVGFTGDISMGIQHYESLPMDNGLDDVGFCQVSAPISSLTVTSLVSNIAWYEKFCMQVDLTCDADINGLVFRLVFYNWSDAWVADSICALPDGHDVPKGESSYLLETAEMPLKNGNYSITMHAMNSKGDILAWSHKQHRLAISKAGVRNFADCQISGACHRIESVAVNPTD